MRVVLLGSGRGSNAEAVLLAQQAGKLGVARVAALFSDVPGAGILALGPRFGVPASYVDPAPFRTKLEGEGEARFIAAVSAVRPDLDAIGQALKAGASSTGCTVHRVTLAVDAGPILGQAAVPIVAGETHESLAAKVHGAEHALLPSVIAKLSHLHTGA